jgi:hypothetical protein
VYRDDNNNLNQCDQGGSIMHALLTQEARGQYTAEYSSKSRRAWARPLIIASAVGVAAWFCSAAHAEVK